MYSISIWGYIDRWIYIDITTYEFVICIVSVWKGVTFTGSDLNRNYNRFVYCSKYDF